MQAGQVATRLGYANASAFTRAFLRWSGMAPQQPVAARGGRRPTGNDSQLRYADLVICVEGNH
jgi:AraC-like DNA-binding protein